MCKYKCFIELRNTKDYQKDKKFANDRFTVTLKKDTFTFTAVCGIL